MLRKKPSRKVFKLFLLLIEAEKNVHSLLGIRICNELNAVVNWSTNNAIVLRQFLKTGVLCKCSLNILKIYNTVCDSSLLK